MIPWPVDHRGGPLECQASPLEPEHWRCELRDCGSGTRAIEHDDIGWIADGDAVVLEVHELRRRGGYEIEQGRDLGCSPDLGDVGIEIGHPD